MMRKNKPALHDCDGEHRYDSARNKAVTPLGTLWTCPTCKAIWMRTTETSQGALYALGWEPLVWTRLTRRQIRWMDKLIQNAPSMRRI